MGFTLTVEVTGRDAEHLREGPSEGIFLQLGAPARRGARWADPRSLRLAGVARDVCAARRHRGRCSQGQGRRSPRAAGTQTQGHLQVPRVRDVGGDEGGRGGRLRVPLAVCLRRPGGGHPLDHAGGALCTALARQQAVPPAWFSQCTTYGYAGTRVHLLTRVRAHTYTTNTHSQTCFCTHTLTHLHTRTFIHIHSHSHSHTHTCCIYTLRTNHEKFAAQS